MLRAINLGLSIEELDVFTVGQVIDMLIECQNDSFEYPAIATQDDINQFFK